MKNITIFIFLAIILNACDNIQDSRPATVKPNNTTVITPTGPAFTNPNCNPGVNKTVCSGLLNLNLTYSTNNPIISVVNSKLTVTYNNSQNDQLTIVLSPFIAGKSNDFDICSSSSLAVNYKAFIQIIGNSLDLNSKLNAKSTGKEKLHVKYNPGNSSYNLVFCDSEFKYDFNSSIYLKNITGRFDFVY